MKPSIAWDCHVHSSFSEDSPAPMEQMIQAAISRGLSGICFTEHLDPDYPPTPDNLRFSLDIPAYHSEFCRLQEKYAFRISALFGIELGLQPHLSRDFHTLLDTVSFDFVIGSSHIVHGYDPYYPDFFEGRNIHDCYMEYYESILENLRVFHEMDVYGHLDYIVRYGPGQGSHYCQARYQDILDEILKQLIGHGIGLELNTGGYRYGLGRPNPDGSILRRYRQLGGEIVTIGADAHEPAYAAHSFDQAACLLQECGFSYYTVFQKRKPVFLKLAR